MELAALRIFVDDLATARRFYEDTLNLAPHWAQPDAVGYRAGIDLIVEPVAQDADPEDRALVGRFVGCSFAVADIAARYAELTGKGVVFTGPPAPQSWGGTLAHFHDPSGNILTLVQL